MMPAFLVSLLGLFIGTVAGTRYFRLPQELEAEDPRANVT